MGDRFVHLALLEQRVAEVVLGFREVRFDLQRLLVMGDRFVHASLLEQSVAEVVLGNEVVRRAGQRVSPQRFTVSPIRGLSARAENQSHEDDRGAAAQHQAAVTPAGAQIRRRPGQQQIQADLRQISVTIRMGVEGYLHHPDHRDQHSQIPEPANHETGMRLAKGPCRSGYGQQQPQRPGHLPERQIVCRVGINTRQSRWMDHLPKVGDVGHHGVFRPQREGQHEFSGQFLGNQGRRHARADRQHQQGDFLGHPPEQNPGREAGKPVQRPVIQQQEDEGHRHQHVLGQQSQGEEQHHGAIAELRGRAAHITDIGSERQHEKKRAQNVLALGDPGHRLHVQRMNGKHRRHKRAAPQEPRHPPQHQKEQDRRCRVEQDIGEVMAARLQPV